MRRPKSNALNITPIGLRMVFDGDAYIRTEVFDVLNDHAFCYDSGKLAKDYLLALQHGLRQGGALFIEHSVWDFIDAKTPRYQLAWIDLEKKALIYDLKDKDSNWPVFVPAGKKYTFPQLIAYALDFYTPGTYVHYERTKIENGRVKGTCDSNDFVYVVYKCRGNWDMYDQYTAKRTHILDLVAGWSEKAINAKQSIKRDELHTSDNAG